MATVRVSWRAAVVATLIVAAAVPANLRRDGQLRVDSQLRVDGQLRFDDVTPGPWPDVEVPRAGPHAVGTEQDRLAALAGEADVQARKRRFVALVLPLIQAENVALLAERRAVEALVARIAMGRLGPVDRARLERIKRAYGVATDDPAALLDRVDAVPASLALAQAAVESGWGTSRFARQGNALYGQRAWSPSLGLVPEAHAGEAAFAVKSFASLGASIRSYMRNLNRHPEYAGFRAARAGLRAAGLPLDGEHLAGTLTAYSEAGQDYVRLVQRVLRDNRFDVHDFSATAGLAGRAFGSSRRVVQGSG
ncbi:MAG: glucosaminidase domain-containing protein [Alphaproteobacteria bacterium]